MKKYSKEDITRLYLHPDGKNYAQSSPKPIKIAKNMKKKDTAMIKEQCADLECCKKEAISY